MARWARSGEMKQEEDWDAECLETPPCKTNVAATDNNVRHRNQASRVFYNHRFSHRQHEPDGQMNRRDETKNSTRESYRTNGGSDSSETQDCGINDDRRFGNQGLRAFGTSRRGQTPRRMQGRGRGTYWEDADKMQSNARPPHQNGFNRERRQTNEQPERFQVNEWNDRPSQTGRPTPRNMQKHQWNTKSPEISDPLNSPVPTVNKPDAPRIPSVKDDQDFPSLAVPSTNSTQVPNFWKDRRAFVDDARPATEGEEAEMVRRALEESRLMEEARQKTLLAEAESRRSLKKPGSSELAPDAVGVPGEMNTRDSSGDSATNTCFSAVDVSGSPTVVSSSRKLPAIPAASVSARCSDDGETHLTVTNTKPADSGISLPTNTDSAKEAGGQSLRKIVPGESNGLINHTVFSNSNVPERHQQIYSFSFDSGISPGVSPENFPDSSCQETPRESAVSLTPPDVIYQRVSEDRDSHESAAPEVIYQRGPNFDEPETRLSNERLQPRVAAADGSACDAVVFGLSAGRDQQHLFSDAGEQCARDNETCGDDAEVDNRATVPHRIPDDDVDGCLGFSNPSSEVCYSPIPSPSPKSTLYSESGGFPMMGPVATLPLPASTFPSAIPGYSMIPAPALGTMPLLPGYHYVPGAMPPLSPWPYYVPGMMLPPAGPPAGAMPPPGFIPAPLHYPPMSMPPRFFLHHGLSLPGYPCLAGSSVLPQVNATDGGDDYKPMPKDS